MRRKIGGARILNLQCCTGGILEKKEIIERLKLAVVNGDQKLAISSAENAIKMGIDVHEIIQDALAKGMAIVSEKWEKHEYFIPQLLMAADAMKDAFTVLNPHLKADKAKIPSKVIMGTVKGDIHDIGKNIVIAFLRAAGIEVFDLGVDVSPEIFVQKVREMNPDIVGSSTFMTTTMGYQKEIELALRKAGVREKVITMIGGPATTPAYAQEIGADGWSKDALEAVKKVQELLQKRGSI